MLWKPCCEASGKTLDRILATGVGSAKLIIRARGPWRGMLLELLEPQAFEGVPGQKFTGVASPAGELFCEPCGVGGTLSGERMEAGLRSGAQQEDMRRSVLVPLCGV